MGGQPPTLLDQMPAVLQAAHYSNSNTLAILFRLANERGRFDVCEPIEDLNPHRLNPAVQLLSYPLLKKNL